MALHDPFATGNTAKIYVSDGAVTKVFSDADFPTVELEASKQRAAHAMGLPVPAVIEVTEVDGKPALVMEYVPGRTMLEAIGDDLGLLPRYLTKSIKIQRAMHSTSAVGLLVMEVKLERQVHEATGVPDERKAELIAELADLGSQASVCHGDFHLQNLIVNGDDVTIIDWMDATAGDPALDVCRSYVLYDSMSDVAAGMYLQEYCSQTGLPPEDVLRWVPVIAAARLSEQLNDGERQRLLALAT